MLFFKRNLGVVAAAIGLSFAAIYSSAVSAAGSSQAAARACLSECTPRIGIVSAFGAEADILLAETQKRRDWRINGNRYTTGVLRGNRVVIVLSGVSMINATMTTQLMLNHFRISHLIMSGIAGGVNPSHHIGDVMVPQRWNMPMEVYWNGDNKTPAPCGAEGDLACLGLKLAMQNGQPRASFNLNTGTGKSPAGLFLRDNFVMRSDTAPAGEYRFDYEVDAEMLAVARTLKPKLLQCSEKDAKLCVNHQPELRVGGAGISGTAFLANAEYRTYLFDTLKADVVDMETAALAHVAYANQIPYIAFRSVSDLAGGNDFKEVGAFFGSGLAETNEAAVTLEFLAKWKQRKKQ